MAGWFYFTAIVCIELSFCVGFTTVSSKESTSLTRDKDSSESQDVETQSSSEESSEDRDIFRSPDYRAEQIRSCANFDCPVSQRCELDAYLQPYCACELNCAEIYEPVCATDGKTYSNRCKLTLAACDADRSINLIYEGKCGSLKSTGWYLLMKIALPTGIVATVVFMCLLVCWCRKGAEYQYRCCPPHLPSYEEDERTYRQNHNIEPIIPVQYNNRPISIVTIPRDVYTNGSDPQQHISLLESSTAHGTPPPSYAEATRS